jgi:hypothetical protein
MDVISHITSVGKTSGHALADTAKKSKSGTESFGHTIKKGGEDTAKGLSSKSQGKSSSSSSSMDSLTSNPMMMYGALAAGAVVLMILMK